MNARTQHQLTSPVTPERLEHDYLFGGEIRWTPSSRRASGHVCMNDTCGLVCDADAVQCQRCGCFELAPFARRTTEASLTRRTWNRISHTMRVAVTVLTP